MSLERAFKNEFSKYRTKVPELDNLFRAFMGMMQVYLAYITKKKDSKGSKTFGTMG